MLKGGNDYEIFRSQAQAQEKCLALADEFQKHLSELDSNKNNLVDQDEASIARNNPKMNQKTRELAAFVDDGYRELSHLHSFDLNDLNPYRFFSGGVCRKDMLMAAELVGPFANLATITAARRPSWIAAIGLGTALVGAEILTEGAATPIALSLARTAGIAGGGFLGTDALDMADRQKKLRKLLIRD
jgi:hypothetical protein